MARSNHIKIGVLVLALSLVCAGVILLSNTFANGVNYDIGTPNSTVEPGKGTYDLDLQSQSKQNSTPVDIIKNGKQIENAVFTEGMFWCPGRTEIIYLTLTNNESFPVNATLHLNVSNSQFDDVLSYAVMTGLTPNCTDHPSSWNNFVAASDTKASVTLENNESHLLVKQLPLSPNKPVYVAVAIQMDTAASDHYQEKTMELQFSLQTDANYLPSEDPKTADLR